MTFIVSWIITGAALVIELAVALAFAAMVLTWAGWLSGVL